MTETLQKQIINTAVNGMITTRRITENGISRAALSELVDSGKLIRCARGIYVLADEWEDEFFILQQRYAKGIYSHATALYLYGYSERVPLKFHMTFPTNYNCPSLKNENVIVTRVNAENYTLGVSEVTSSAGNKVKTYDLERSLCDVLRGSGDDIQIIQYAMKKYAASREKDVNKLMRYARQLRVEPKVRRYMEVLL